jgi:predicted MFS family arabinose efflux permease
MLLVALGHSFELLLLAFVLMYPASGAFVSLSQASLMDLAPDRREANMVRWTIAGAVGALAGTALQQRLRNRTLSLLFAALLFAVAIKLLV